MNIIHSPFNIVAKTCGCKENNRVSYLFLEEPHGLCIDKKDLLEAQIQACEMLLKYAKDVSERAAVQKEIDELRMARDLMT
jgi:hypothetical protein